ncbi:hypothetical protein [Streptomyces hirsutus]|uniref:hypothetical protein n=1 Tax=Streptomyces hirsutus TaxID=35620 RepID=UPI000A3EB4EC|nr:hypothetical protein [Streptomyces hirsutus]
MGSLFEELEARESAAREQVDVLEEELAELTGRLEGVCQLNGSVSHMVVTERHH